MKRLALIPLAVAALTLHAAPASACGQNPCPPETTTGAPPSSSSTTTVAPPSSTTTVTASTAPQVVAPRSNGSGQPSTPSSEVIDQPVTHPGEPSEVWPDDAALPPNSGASATSSTTWQTLPSTGRNTDLALGAAIVLAAGLTLIVAARRRPID